MRLGTLRPLRVMFVHTEQYVDYVNELFSLSVRDPVTNSGARIEVHDFVRNHRVQPPDLDAEAHQLLRQIEELKIDVVVYFASWQDLPPWCLEEIRRAHVPIFGILPDTLLETGEHELLLASYADYLGVFDSVTNYFRYRMLFDLTKGKPGGVLFLSGFHVRPERFAKRPAQKTRDVVILGSAEGERRAIIDRLEGPLTDKGIKFEKQGGLVDSAKQVRGLSDGWIDIDSYIDVVNESKILILSQTQKERKQVKGKIFEFLSCGAFCLVDRNVEYDSLIGDSGIVFWDDFDDLVAKCEYYVAHDDEREAIAAATHRWFLETFDYRAFWSGFFEHVRDPSRPLPVLDRLEVAYGQLRTHQGKARVRLMQALAPASLMSPPPEAHVSAAPQQAADPATGGFAARLRRLLPRARGV